MLFFLLLSLSPLPLFLFNPRFARAASKAATDSAAGTPPPPPAPASPSPLTPKEVITQSAIVIRSTTRQLDRNRYILSSLSQSLNQLSALLSYYFNITLNFVPNGINGSNVQVARTTLEGGGWSERGITEYAWPVFFGTTPSMYLGTPYANKSDYEYSKILDRHALGTYFNTLLRGQVVTMLVYGEAARRTDELVKTAVRERDVLVATDEANHECLDDKGLQVRDEQSAAVLKTALLLSYSQTNPRFRATPIYQIAHNQQRASEADQTRRPLLAPNQS